MTTPPSPDRHLSDALTSLTFALRGLTDSEQTAATIQDCQEWIREINDVLTPSRTVHADSPTQPDAMPEAEPTAAFDSTVDEARLDTYARNFEVSPQKFRRLLVGELCRDITAEVLELAERTQRLEELISRVSPTRAERLTESLTPYLEELVTVQDYLRSLRLDPMSWPTRQ